MHYVDEIGGCRSSDERYQKLATTYPGQLRRNVVLKNPIRAYQPTNTVLPNLIICRVGISNYAWYAKTSKRFPASSFEGLVTHIKEG